MAKRLVSLVAIWIFLGLGACATDYHSLASESIDEEQFEAAVAYLEKGASEGDERCDYQLAILMLQGEIDGNSETAVRLLHKAATAGYPPAQFDLGLLYEKGEGVPQDPVEATDWYRKAAEAGFPIAQTNLGLLYAVGRVVDKDPEAAARWYRKAAKGGDPLGQAALGAAIFNGVGTKKDLVDGYMWTTVAATQGEKGARSRLPVMSEKMTERELQKARYEARKYIASQSEDKKNRFKGKRAHHDSRSSTRERIHGNRRPQGM